MYMAEVVANHVRSIVKTTCATYSMENVLPAWLAGWGHFATRVRILRQ